MNVQGKVFAVTGASGGIGSALVKTLLNKGAFVAAIDLNHDALQGLSNALSQHSTNLAIYAVDITNKTAVETLPSAISAQFGHIDAIINCAGIIQPFVKVNQLDYQSIEKVMNVNFYGTLFMTKTFLPILLARPEAYVVNVSSMGGFLPVPGQGVYGASKAAVKLLTEALYAELIDTNVRVSVVFPGATATDITKNSGVNTPKMADAAKQKSVPMLSADDAARQIVHGIEKNKPQIFTGKDSKLMNHLYRVNPIFATKFIAKQMKSLLQ